jgi:FtsP/CotA-like multicopper oxidase with cupredoxin domain
MNTLNTISRRRFLQYSSLGVAALGFPGWLFAMEKKHPNVASANFHPDVELELFARPASVGILPGTLTNVYKYFGTVLKGPANSLADIPGTYLGPIFRFQRGQKVRIHFRNELDEPCITHWHGMHVPHISDGHPMYAIDKGETWVYEFEVDNRAGTYFYHPHTHGETGKQVYMGLSGMILVEDEEEKKLNLPAGEYEIPLVIQDRSFDAGNQLVYVTHNMQKMMGFHGNHILVNGKPDFELQAASRAYRLRIANGSNSRIYKLAWDDGTPITVIGVDGGLLETPVQKPYVMMGPGERIDVWADFSNRAVGSEWVMRSKPFSGALPAMHEQMMAKMGHGGDGKSGQGTEHGGGQAADNPQSGMDHGQGGGMGMGMMGGMMGAMSHGGYKPGSEAKKDGMDHGQGSGMGMMGGGGMMGMMPGMKLPQGSDYPIFKVRITRKGSDSPALPEKLCTIKRYALKDAANPDKPVPIGISEGMMSMLLNGRPYKLDDVQEFEKIKVNTLQVLEIFHAHGMGGGAAGGEHGAEGAQKPAEGGMEHGQQGGGSGMGMMGGMNHGGDQAGNQPKPEGQGGMDHGQGGGGMGMGMMGGGMMGGMMGHGGMQQEQKSGNAQGGGMDHGQAGGGGMGMMGGMGGGMSGMMSMAHPIHIHGQQFQILSRSRDMNEPGYETVKDGFIDAGWKDVVLVMPGERLRIIKPFDTYTGLFTYHCHNLEHEDLGMMRDFLVG